MEIIKGDLLKLAKEGKFDVIVHGANCFCTMGSGIARQIREQYPEAYEADCKTVAGDRNKLGTYTGTPTKDGFVVINAYTQYDFNRAGENADVFEYDAFLNVLTTLAVNTAFRINYGFPLIGTGLAGGDKERILGMIELFSQLVEDTGSTVTVVEYQPE